MRSVAIRSVTDTQFKDFDYNRNTDTLGLGSNLDFQVFDVRGATYILSNGT